MVSKPLSEYLLAIEFFANLKRLLYCLTLFSTFWSYTELLSKINQSPLSSPKSPSPLTNLHSIGSFCSSLYDCYTDSRLPVSARIGKQKAKTLPEPGPSESTDIVPPIFSTIVFTMSRQLILSFPSENSGFIGLSSKRSPSSSNGIPTPVSHTWTTRLELATLYNTLSTMLPCGVNSIAFLIRLVNTCIKRRSSPSSHGRLRRLD